MRYLLAALAACGLVFTAQATMIPGISLEEMVAKSDSIVTGKVGRSWTAWDPAHQYIWTHTEILVSSVTKGAAGRTVVVSEPGGELDGRVLRVEGAVEYEPGEEVLLFLANTPIGYKRTVGWAQGKYLVTADRHIRATAPAAHFVTRRGGAASGTSLRELEGAPLSAVRDRVVSLMRVKGSVR